MSLNEFLKQNAESGVYPFHMPGHKRNRKFIDTDALDLDITEIHGADNFHAPNGHIKKIFKALAKLYCADESFLLINGSTGGITAAILALCGDGEKVLVARNSHRSVFGGLILSGAEPVYLYPNIDPHGFCLGIEPEDVKAALEADKSISAVVITSPTYEGVCSDIAAIADIAHHAGALLIVDEAHGAHFGFNDYFPKSSVQLGADIVIHSLHKTMPVLTQTSAIHVKGGLVDCGLLADSLSITQSSSPSYILMSAAENFIEEFNKNHKIHFDNYVEMLYPLRRELQDMRTFRLLEPGRVYDRGKLLFHTGEEYTGSWLAEILRREYGIEPEMNGARHVLAMTSVADTKDGFGRLLNAIRDIDSRYKPYKKCGDEKAINKYNFKSIKVMSPRKAFRSKKRIVEYRRAAGMTAAGFVIPYPPGVPLLAPGELITPEIIEAINSYKTVLGVDGGKLPVIYRRH